MKKQHLKIFGKDQYLIGVDSEGTKYYLSSPSWNCGWYWGFGYISTFTNNRSPSLSKEIASHEHATDFYLRWLPLSDGSRLVNTPFTEKEQWKLAELMKQFYTLRESAEIFGRGNCHISPTEVASLKNEEWASHINETLIPQVTEQIINIVKPA